MSKASDYAARVKAANESVPTGFKITEFSTAYVSGDGGLHVLGSDQHKVPPERMKAYIAWLKETFED
jgi:hypothetical protein